MKASLYFRGSSAATLAETLVATAVTAFMFAAILTGAVALHQIFSSAVAYSAGSADQQRAIDYISRDLRRAYTVTVSSSNQTLTVTAPDYYAAYDEQGNPSGNPVSPTITNGVVNYQDPAKPITISYYVNNGQLLRQQTVEATGATNTLVIANNVSNLQSGFADLTSVVTFNVTFAPRWTNSDPANTQARAGTTLTASASVRNARRDHL